MTFSAAIKLHFLSAFFLHFLTAADSSFFNDIVIDTEEKVKNLVVALEKSERSQSACRSTDSAKVTDADEAWISKTFSKSAEKR
jgi:hypothetical protein